MKSKIILIIPYYGCLPDYFITWSMSVQHLEGFVDCALVTDEPIKHSEIPSNVKVFDVTFNEIQDRIRKAGIKYPPFTAYKICDYRGAFALIFPEIVEGYEYWGHCDMDTVFGDVETFLTGINYEDYDRIGLLGHFAIYRNNVKTKSLFLYDIPNDNYPFHHFKNIGKTTYPCHFDEEGMNLICDAKGLRFYKEYLMFNTTEKSKHIHTINYKNDYELLTWEQGHTYRYHFDDKGEIVRDEQMYIHYGIQKNMPQIDELGDSFFLCHDGFRHLDKSKLPSLLKEYGRPDSDEERQKEEAEFKSMLRKRRRARMITEFKTCRFGAIRNMIYRAQGLIDVIKYRNL